MRPRIIVDTGPLVALLDRRDHYHDWVKKQLESIDPPLDTCEAVLSEAAFLLSHVPGGSQALIELVVKGLVVVSFSLQTEARPIRFWNDQLDQCRGVQIEQLAALTS